MTHHPPDDRTTPTAQTPRDTAPNNPVELDRGAVAWPVVEHHTARILLEISSDALRFDVRVPTGDDPAPLEAAAKSAYASLLPDEIGALHVAAKVAGEPFILDLDVGSPALRQDLLRWHFANQMREQAAALTSSTRSRHPRSMPSEEIASSTNLLRPAAGPDAHLLRIGHLPPDPNFRLVGLEEELERNHQPTIDALQEYLTSLEGTNFGSFEQNKAFAKRLRRLLSKLDLRLECTTCGGPAVLVAKPKGIQGAFSFQHTISGAATDHTGATKLPKLKLVYHSKPEQP